MEISAKMICREIWAIHKQQLIGNDSITKKEGTTLSIVVN